MPGPISRALILMLTALCLANPAGAASLRERLAERRLPAGVTLSRDVAYGADPAQRFDVYAPAGAVRAPVIFMVHGGAWRFGDKGADAVIEHKVAHWVARGYVLISVNYRMLPAADPLEQARDVASALGFAQERAPQWGADRASFILMGHSAGAHLVALIASSPGFASKTSWLGTVALDSAAFDVEQLMAAPHYRLHDAAFGSDAQFWKAASPYAAARAAGQPMLAVCSTRRADSCAQAQRYAARAGALGTRVQLLPLDLSHADINATLGQDSDYTRAVDAFMRALRPAQ